MAIDHGNVRSDELESKVDEVFRLKGMEGVMRSHMISGILPLLALIGCAPTLSEEGLDPQRVTVKVDREVSVIEPSKETGLAHEMLGMVRHPDGTIFVSTET